MAGRWPVAAIVWRASSKRSGGGGGWFRMFHKSSKDHALPDLAASVSPQKGDPPFSGSAMGKVHARNQATAICSIGEAEVRAAQERRRKGCNPIPFNSRRSGLYSQLRRMHPGLEQRDLRVVFGCRGPFRFRL